MLRLNRNAILKLRRFGSIYEDVYFSLLLRVIGAPLPSDDKASSFGMDQDSTWPFDASAPLYAQEMKEYGHALPVGQHKCFLGERCASECKYSFGSNETKPER